MSMHIKKMIAPTVITILTVLYYVGFFVFAAHSDRIPAIFKILYGIGLVVVSGLLIYVLWKRIKEIRSGEEDDLSKY